MEFEISFDDTKQFIGRAFFSRTISSVLLLVPLLYFCYLLAQIAYYCISKGSSHVPSTLFILLNDLFFLILLISLVAVQYSRILCRYFNNRHSFMASMKFGTDGYSSATEDEISLTRWRGVLKTKRTEKSFVITLHNGDTYIPMNILSDEQMTFIESRVQQAKKSGDITHERQENVH